MKNIFSKRIETKKADPFAELVTALSDAIAAAVKADVPHGLIQREFESHAADFRRAEEARAEARRANPTPQMFDALTLKPINSHEQMARAEERRNAAELRRQQAEYARSVDERGRAEARRRGEVL
jgi:hypothetical protein